MLTRSRLTRSSGSPKSTCGTKTQVKICLLFEMELIMGSPDCDRCGRTDRGTIGLQSSSCRHVFDDLLDGVSGCIKSMHTPCLGSSRISAVQMTDLRPFPFN